MSRHEHKKAKDQSGSYSGHANDPNFEVEEVIGGDDEEIMGI